VLYDYKIKKEIDGIKSRQLDTREIT